MWGYVKHHAYDPSLPDDLAEPKQRLSAEIITVLRRLWDESAYRIDMTRVSR